MPDVSCTGIRRNITIVEIPPYDRADREHHVHTYNRVQTSYHNQSTPVKDVTIPSHHRYQSKCSLGAGTSHDALVVSCRGIRS